jgi:predicted Zn-dependent peptidase
VTTPSVHTLANGVRVVADPMPGLESLALSVVVKGGARWESPERAGWAHMLEHMVFKGAGGRSAREIVEAIEAEGGQINAATGQERTSFQVRCLKGGLPLGMAVIADLVRRPLIDPEELEREKEVIAQEIAEAADQPDDLVFDLALGAAFGGHPLGRPVLGKVESLAPATRETLSSFHRGLYAPDRLVVSAAGAIEEDELLRLAEALFGDMPPAGALEAPTPPGFLGLHSRETRKLEQAHLVMMLPGVDRHHPDIFAQGAFVEIFGGGMSSRLFQEAREARGLAYAIDAYEDAYDDTGLVGVYAGVAAGKAGETARLSGEILKRLIADATPGELSRAKAQVRAGYFMRREQPLARAEQNASQLLFFGRLFATTEVAAEIEAVGLGDLRRVGERMIEAGRSASAVLGPARAAEAGRVFAETVAAG